MSDYKAIFDYRGHEYNRAESISPTARQEELDTLLRHAAMFSEATVVDIPAGGGAVARRIEQLGLPHHAIVCVEPSEIFAAAIPGHLRVLHNPLHEIALADHSVDLILSLAGLHHIIDRRPVYREWFRVLKPKGQLVVADVLEGTPTARFLNGFVHEHCHTGHEGAFIRANEFTECLAEAGFRTASDALRDVPWRFADRSQLGRFCRTLFKVDKATVEEVVKGVATYIGISGNDNGVSMEWQLQYASAFKP
jgi:SAM-dependent methyltransferase